MIAICYVVSWKAATLITMQIYKLFLKSQYVNK